MKKNAGIKSTKEAAQRLIDGEVFWCDGYELKFDDQWLNPFRTIYGLNNTEIDDEWSCFDAWQIEIDWRENIGKGVWCWVWGDEYENKFRAVVIRYMPDKIHKYMIETPSNFAAWKNAEPMTETEVMEYILNE